MKIFLFLFLILLSALAQAVTADISIVNSVTTAMLAASNASIMPQALIWLGSFMSVQFVITNLGLLKSGADIEAVVGKLIGSLLWFGFCIYIMNNAPNWIDDVGTGALVKFAPNLPTVGSIITSTLALCSAILAAIAVVGTSVAGFSNSTLGSLLLDILILVFSVGMYMAIKIFMLTLELGLIIMLSPLSFSFLGLNALKDQGIAPFKSLISLVYRIVLIGIICSSFGTVVDGIMTALKAVSWKNPTTWSDGVQALFSGICAFPILGYLLYKSDAIASSLASGTTNMGPADIGSAVAAGVAAGGAMNAASQAAGAGITSMSDVIKNMMGGNGGEIKQAGSAGAGGQTDLAAGAPVGGGSAPVASLAELKAMAPKEDAAQGGSPSVGGESDSSGGGVTSSSTGSASGAAGGGSAPAFSKADGAKAAAAVSGGQARKNTAAVNAAMQATGANASAAGAAEMVAEKGGSAAEVAAAAAAWNATPAQQAAIHEAFAGAADTGAMTAAPSEATASPGAAAAPATSGGSAQPAAPAPAAASKPGEPSWLESGSATSPAGGSGANAGIGGEAQKMGFGDHMKNLGGHLAEVERRFQKSESTQVSISTHHSD